MFLLTCKIWINEENIDPGKGRGFGKRGGGQGREMREDKMIKVHDINV